MKCCGMCKVIGKSGACFRRKIVMRQYHTMQALRAMLALYITTQIALGVVHIMSRSRYDHEVTERYHSSPAESEFAENYGRYKPECRRNDHIVYIKTHKTASTTVTSMLWRMALRRNLHVLTFDTLPFVKVLFLPYTLDNHTSLHKMPRIDMIAEHLVYYRDDFTSIMPDETVYVSSLREPVSQLKSMMKFFQIPLDYNITSENPAHELITNLEMYISNRTEFDHKFWNTPNAYSLGWEPKPGQLSNVTKAGRFVSKIQQEFDHMVIFEHFDESVIVLRRMLCWELSDILYLPLRFKNQTVSEADVAKDNETKVKLRNLSSADFLLHERFNNILWINIQKEGHDFRDELKFFQKQKNRVRQFCERVIQLIKLDNRIRMKELLDSGESIFIPESPWGNSYKIDFVWCLMSKLNMLMFRNILRVKEYPELCYHLTKESDMVPLNKFHKDRLRPEVRMNSAYCSRNRTSSTSTFQIPLEILLATHMYNI